MKRVSPQEASELVAQGYTYVDVRSQPEFEAGHPAGALNVPLAFAGPFGMQPNPDFVSVMQANFPADAKLVVGCQAGMRSMRAVQTLEGAGYTDVVDQRAGFGGARNMSGQVTEQGWKDAGLPVESAAKPGAAYADLAAKAVAAKK